MASVAAIAYVPGPLRRARTPGVCAMSVATGQVAAGGSGRGWEPMYRALRRLAAARRESCVCHGIHEDRLGYRGKMITPQSHNGSISIPVESGEGCRTGVAAEAS